MEITRQKEIAVPEDGAHIIENMPAQQYHARPEISVHGLMKVLDAPAKFIEERTKPKDPTPAMRLGSLIHLAVLEPDRFKSDVAVLPDGIDKRSKEGKAAWAQFQAKHAGKEIITADEVELLEAIASSVLSSQRHTRAARLLKTGDGISEGSMFWTGHMGMRCKGRFDRFTFIAERPVLIDLKKMKDASDSAMERSIAEWRYHMQAAFYIDGFCMCRPDLPPPTYVIVAVEDDAPYLVNQKKISDAAIAEGRRLYRKGIEAYASCRESNNWPGYADTILTAELPTWYRGA